MTARNYTLRSDDDWKRFGVALRALDRSKPWEASVRPYRKGRSIQANNLFHAWMAILGDHTGYSLEDMKVLMKEQFLTPRMVSFRGMNRLLYPSTAELKSAEFTAFMDKIQAWAATDLGVTLPSTL